MTATFTQVVEMYINGAWVDVTGDVQYDQKLVISHGRRDERNQASPSSLALRLLNTSNNYSPRNATGIYYGLIGRNTPIRVRETTVAGHVIASDPFTRTVVDGWGNTPDNWIWAFGNGTNAERDVNGTEATVTVASSFNTDRHQYLYTASIADVEVVSSFKVNRVATAGFVNIPGVILARESQTKHIQVGYYLGNSNPLVLFLGQDSVLITQIDTGFTYSPGSKFWIRARKVGRRVQARGWADGSSEPTTWHIDRYVEPTTLPGSVGTFTLSNDSVATTYTFDDFTAKENPTNDVRFHGEISSWKPGRDGSGKFRYMDIEAAGILRRLGQGKYPLASAPARYIPTTVSLMAYWPLEDGASVPYGTPLAGVYPMKPFQGTHPSGAVITYPQWGQGTLASWLPSVVSRSGNKGLTVLWAPVAMASFVDTWTVDFLYNSGTDAGVSNIDINPSYLPEGGTGWPQLIMTPSIEGLDVTMNGEPEHNATVDGLYNGQLHHIRFTATQFGTKVSYEVRVDGVVKNSGATAGNMTLKPIETIGLSAEAQNSASIAQGHVAIWTVPPLVTTAVNAAFGYRGETAGARILRLCTEENVPLDARGDFTKTEIMGSQRTAKLLDLLRDAEEVDGGILHDTRHEIGLTYRTSYSMYNQIAKASLDFAEAEPIPPFIPIEDDQAIRNDVTITRQDGVSARSVLETGSMSVEDIGTYDEQKTLILNSDLQPKDHAAWRRHLGTINEYRYPQMATELGNQLIAVIYKMSTLGLGDKLDIVNPPTDLTYDPIEQMVQGYTETWDQFTCRFISNCSPYSGWYVFQVEHSIYGRLDTSGSELAAGVSSTDGSLLVATDSGGALWITTATRSQDFPFSLQFGGETVIVRSIVGTTSPQTFTVTRSLGTAIAPAAGNSANAGYIVVSDAEAVDFSVGNQIQLLTSTRALKESTIFTITSKVSAFGFTNLNLSPNAAVSPVTGDYAMKLGVVKSHLAGTRASLARRAVS